jgi:hypothetical protein
MLTEIEINELINIEAAAKVLIEKCEKLRRSAAPNGGRKKTKKQLMNERVDEWLQRKQQRIYAKSLK